MTFCGLADYRPIPRSTKVRPAYRASNVLLKIARNGKSPVPRSIRSTGLKLIWRCQSEWSCSQCLTFAAIPFPDFQTAGFSSSRPQSRQSIPRGFSLGFVMGGRSFLLIGIEKGQSISRLSLVVYSLLVSITYQRLLLLHR